MSVVHLDFGCFCLWLAATSIDAETPSRSEMAATATYTQPKSEARPANSHCTLSQQSCNTQCQEQQTDCALRCDQDAPCIRRCRAAAEDCTARCVQGPAAPPAENPRPTAGLLRPTVEAVWASNQS